MTTRRSLLTLAAAPALLPAASSKTKVEIRGNQFFINGKPTYKGRIYKGHKIEGLLMNSRMVQGIFDDKNPATVTKWAYPDTKKWDANRNVNEFLAAMPLWRKQGLLSFTINLQGGSPEGYSKSQPWHTSGIAPDGSLLPDFMARVWPENSIRRLPTFNQGLHLRPKLRDLRVGECPGNSTDETGDAKIVDTAHTSGAPAVHD